jgi:hypothetical protein
VLVAGAELQVVTKPGITEVKADVLNRLAGREPIGDLLNPDSSLGDIQNEPKGVVIIQIDRLTVQVQKDGGC